MCTHFVIGLALRIVTASYNKPLLLGEVYLRFHISNTASIGFLHMKHPDNVVWNNALAACWSIDPGECGS